MLQSLPTSAAESPLTRARRHLLLMREKVKETQQANQATLEALARPHGASESAPKAPATPPTTNIPLPMNRLATPTHVAHAEQRHHGVQPVVSSATTPPSGTLRASPGHSGLVPDSPTTPVFRSLSRTSSHNTLKYPSLRRNVTIGGETVIPATTSVTDLSDNTAPIPAPPRRPHAVTQLRVASTIAVATPLSRLPMRRTVSTPQGLRATLPDSVTRLMERAPTPVSFSPSPASLLQRLPPSPSLPTFVAVAPSGSLGQAEPQPPSTVDPPGFTPADPTASSPPSTPVCRTRSRGTVRVAPNSHRFGVRRLSMGATSTRAPRRTKTRAQRHRDHTRARHEIATLRDEVCRLESTLQSRTREFNEAHDRLRADLEKAHASAAQLRLTVTEQESKVRDLVDESRQLRAHMTAHGLAVPTGLPRRRGQKYPSSTRTDSSSANSSSGGSVNGEEEKGDRSSSIGPHTLADYVPASPGPPPIIMPSQIVKAASQAAAVAATPVKSETTTPTKASPAPSTPTALPGPHRRSPKPLADAGVEQRRHLLDALTRLSISTLFTKERLHPNGKLERELADGTLAQAYPDGNVKLVMATEPAKIVLVYANGDTQETYPTTGRMVYWYAKDRIRHVHVGNAPEDEDERGCEELWEFVEAGYTEKRYKDGRKEVIYTRGGPTHKTRTGS